MLCRSGGAILSPASSSSPNAPTTTAVGSPALPPDYDLPEDKYVKADYGKIASEFLDEYAGQYVVFDGCYLSHYQGAHIRWWRTL